jgi:small Trp-rich protein
LSCISGTWNYFTAHEVPGNRAGSHLELVDVLTPFALAVAWWAWADSSGYTKRKAMEREERPRKPDRIEQEAGTLGRGGRR